MPLSQDRENLAAAPDPIRRGGISWLRSLQRSRSRKAQAFFPEHKETQYSVRVSRQPERVKRFLACPSMYSAGLEQSTSSSNGAAGARAERYAYAMCIASSRRVKTPSMPISLGSQTLPRRMEPPSPG